MIGMRNTEMSERLRRHGNVALRPFRPARRRVHFVSHAYIVPHATDKTAGLRYSHAARDRGQPIRAPEDHHRLGASSV